MTEMTTPVAVRPQNVREGLEMPLSRYGEEHMPRLEVYGVEVAVAEFRSEHDKLRTPEVARSLGKPALRLEHWHNIIINKRIAPVSKEIRGFA